MNQLVIVVGVILALIAGLGLAAYIVYKGKLRRAKAIERGLKMVPLLIHLPPPSDDIDGGSRDMREVMREKTSQAEVLYNLIAGTAQSGFKSNFYGQRHMGFEIISTNGLIHFYAAVPVNMVSIIENAIVSAYPGARVEEAEDHNVFSKQGKIFGTMGGEVVLKTESSYPIANYSQMERDPMEALLSAMTGVGEDAGAAVQILVRPAGNGWVKRSEKISRKKRRVRQSSTMEFGAKDFAKAALKAPSQSHSDNKPELSNLELSVIEAVENKTKSPGFEVLVRILVSTETVATSQALIQKMATSFALFDQPGLNGFKYLPASNTQGFVTAFILRLFPPALKDMILNTEEIATLFHIPDSQFIPNSSVQRQQGKQVDGPPTLPSTGLLFGYNEFRGVKKEIRLSDQDRRRHTYIIGQTGTGKSTMLENLVAQDLASGKGFAFIDPHGDTAEKFMGMIPKERAEDVIYFNPADMADPLGLNLFEFTDPLQKDFLIQESLGMLYKIYDPDKTGIIGPRFEQWYRNAALTLMADPNGATFIEIPKVFTDTEYLKNKFKYLKDPTVIEFWTKEMGQTSDYHKSEMLGFFVSKFGAFQQNEMMRNIIGQTESSFNMREIMDNNKILIVNLSKGRIGELNSKLLGMMFVIKLQAAAMSRADMSEGDRKDFCLYVDEFQNFSTDSFASILSEARKYRLNLVVANQFIGQLTTEIRDAVFGNVGTIVAHRTGPEDAEFMVKQFAPVFDTRDIINIPNYISAVRLMVGGLPSQPFTMNDLPPVAGEHKELAIAMKELSAAKYGHPRAQVEADITARLTNKLAGADGAQSDPISQSGETVLPPTPISAPVSTSESVVEQATVAPSISPAVDVVGANPGAVPSTDTLNISELKRPVASTPVVPAEMVVAPPDVETVSDAQVVGESINPIPASSPEPTPELIAKSEPEIVPVTEPVSEPPAASDPEPAMQTVEEAEASPSVDEVLPGAATDPIDKAAESLGAMTPDTPIAQVTSDPPSVTEPQIKTIEESVIVEPIGAEPEQALGTDRELEKAQVAINEAVEEVLPIVDEAITYVPTPSAEVTPAVPELAPGEIFVDESGVVHQG